MNSTRLPSIGVRPPDFLTWVLLAAGAIASGAALAQDLDADALRRALSGPDREVADYVRDAARKPVEVLQFVGIKPGMQVLDVYAAGGYYTFHSVQGSWA